MKKQWLYLLAATLVAAEGFAETTSTPQEPDTLAETITATLAKQGSIEPKQAVAWIEEIGGRYSEKAKKIDMSYAGNKPYGDEVLVLASQIPDLKCITLTGSQITDEGLVHLRNLQQLEVLWLMHTRITDNGLGKW